MNNDYKEGYQQAREDGGNNRLAMRAFKRLLNVGAYLPGFAARDAEFFDGYKDGVRDSVRVIQTTAIGANMNDTQGRGNGEGRVEIPAQRATENQPATAGTQATATASAAIAQLHKQVQATTHSTLSGGSSMSNDAADFHYQIQLLNELKQYLNTFQERLVGVSLQYQRKVEALRQAGMMKQTCERYLANEVAQTQALMIQLVEHIDTIDIPRVDTEIAYLESRPT